MTSFLFTSFATALLVSLCIIKIILSIKKLTQIKKYLLVLFLCIFSFIPINGLPVIGYIKVLTGNLSITTVTLIIFALYEILNDNKNTNTKYSISRLMIIISLIGLVFYPMSLGLTFFDPYILGYDTLYMTLFLFISAIIMIVNKLHLIALCIIFAIFAHSFNLLNSSNLWDYCLDFPLFLFSIYFIIKTKILICNLSVKYEKV